MSDMANATPSETRDGFIAPSPRPWVLNFTPHADRMQLFCTKQGHSTHIGTFISGSRSKTALFNTNCEFVSRAVNSHDDLLAAANAVWGNAAPRAAVVGGKVRDYIVPREHMDALRAAIAKAESAS